MYKHSAEQSWLKWVRHLAESFLKMAASPASLLGTPAESEATVDCQLLLTTLAGNEVAISISIAQYDRLDDFEEHTVDYLATVSSLDVFGSEMDFIHPTTQENLQDRIWDAPQENTSFTIVIRECVETFHSKEDFEGCAYRDPKAVRVPASDSGVAPAFLAVPCFRHVVAEEGLHTVGALAWQNCRQLAGLS